MSTLVELKRNLSLDQVQHIYIQRITCSQSTSKTLHALESLITLSHFNLT